jgi:3-methyladenine DNA glycosylase Tag
MKTFNEIYQRALERKGKVKLAEYSQVSCLSADAISQLGDDRILAEITRAVFKAGFVWRVIDQKWQGFEQAFWSFNVDRCAHMSFEDMEALQKDSRIIRNRPKIEAVQQNAVMIRELEAEYQDSYSSIADLIGRWPAQDYHQLIQLFNKRGCRLGAQSSQYFLRFLGRDGYILSRDVVAALKDAGAIDKNPTSMKAQAQVQDAFNQWADESGYSLGQLSRILALSIDA